MRATLDKLISWTGLVLAAVLLVAGGLLTWASSFVGAQVDQQLGDQHITMPATEAIAGDEALSQADKDALTPFAGQDMRAGDQAKAYADHYILAHMNHASEGQTYSEVSGQYMGAGCSDPAKATDATCQQLGGLRQTLFQGSTLRGLLLYGYAFGTIGKIAGFAAIAAFVGTAVMLALGLLGLRHAKLAAQSTAPTARVEEAVTV
ncbi:MAG: hypothetical protein R2731_15150 [Nocardioides sp.]